MPQYRPACSVCAHLHKESNTCAAFPKGIPTKILHGETLHLRPVAGDNGIQFQLREESRATAEQLVELGLFPRGITAGASSSGAAAGEAAPG